MAAPGVASRGALLREITLKSNDILTSHARQTAATARLDAAQSTKGKLQAAIAAAEAEFSDLQAQKTRESENDSELVALQRAHASVTTQRQQLIRDTITARSTRDALREKLLLAHYMHLGTWLERARAAAAASPDPVAALSSVAASACPACVWTEDACSAFRDSEALWKRSSNVSACSTDCLHAALGLHGFCIDVHALGRPADAAAPAATDAQLPPASAAAYSALGAAQLHTDVLRCTSQLDEIALDTEALVSRCEALHAALQSGSDAAASTQPRQDRAAAVTARIEALLMQLVAHVDVQRVVVAQAHALITAAGACTCAATSGSAAAAAAEAAAASAS